MLGEETCISDWECGDPSNEAVKPWVKLSLAITWEAEHRLTVCPYSLGPGGFL